MAGSERESVARAASSAGAEMVEEARRSVVEVRSGSRGSGAGVIWPGDGLVLTNNHVVTRGRRRGGARVVLHDGRVLDAEVVKRSRSLDLALLRMRGETGGLSAAPVGDSDALRVGELVYAIGHPWGNPGTATVGVVGGLGVPGGRSRWGSSTRYVRSDVALAPGNSGGALLNAAGEVVGINAMIFGRTALSIPSNAAAAWAADPGERRPRLGVGVSMVRLPASGRPEEGDTAGLVIHSVEEGGPADAAGLLVGDVLLGVAGKPPSIGVFRKALSRGDAVSLRVMRGGETLVVEVPPRTSGRAA
ncbi:MAG: trypsin-like peptidase domain-containing protein [Rubrobacter sp.]|nr:trypsin-like peptidase domain-containing protein [Rubrobacter sp.]MDQ3362809.1 trypsin-like peptidase domain-containing protein [Actinomycetota bacterium]MDQ3377143.1 trypsin-like peptidase domain-containing protein [Actinomycetota bacterium]